MRLLDRLFLFQPSPVVNVTQGNMRTSNIEFTIERLSKFTRALYRLVLINYLVNFTVGSNSQRSIKILSLSSFQQDVGVAIPQASLSLCYEKSSIFLKQLATLAVTVLQAYLYNRCCSLLQTVTLAATYNTTLFLSRSCHTLLISCFGSASIKLTPLQCQLCTIANTINISRLNISNQFQAIVV